MKGWENPFATYGLIGCFVPRESGGETNEEILQQRELLTQMKSNVEKTCKKVNQVSKVSWVIRKLILLI